MNLIEVILINIILLLFPFLTHLFYRLYTQNVEKKTDDFMLDFALITSLYLQIIFNEFVGNREFLIFLNIPLLIAYLKKRLFSSCIISLSIILCCYFKGNSLFIILYFEYIIIYLIYFFLYKKKKSTFFVNIFIIIEGLFKLLYMLIIKGFTLSNFINILFIIITFALTTHLTLYLLKKGDSIAKLHLSIKQLEQEKQYRTSLFKITHEIKNPIAVCKSYLDMYDSNKKEHQNYIPIVKEEIQKVLLLLQDFACMNKIKIEKEILDITMLIEDVMEQFKPVLNANDISLHYEILDDEIYIEGDYNRLNQVLINVIKNAIEAKKKNRQMLLTIKSYKQENDFVIEIIDNGMGFDMDEFDKIKEPFYTTKKNGTGLGVSLSHEIMEAHNGQIIYESTLNKGTTVKLMLPMLHLNIN